MIMDYPDGFSCCVEAQFGGGGYGQNSIRSTLKPTSRPCDGALECGETAVVAED